MQNKLRGKVRKARNKDNIGFWHGKASQNKILRPEGEEFFLLARKL